MFNDLVKNVLDPESLGIFKLTSIETIRTLKKQCIRFPNLFVAENLQLNESETFGIDVTNSDYVEINTVHDYMRLLNEHK